jgi:DNA-directed RNA polymerase subunit beta
LKDQLRIMEEDTFQRVEKMLIGKVAEGGPNSRRAKITKATDEVWRTCTVATVARDSLRNEEQRAARGRAAQIKQQREEFRKSASREEAQDHPGR